MTPQYLNSGLRDRAAVDLAHKLFEVLDTRLSPRLNDLSDWPEGSLANPLKPNQDIVGTITTADGPMDLVLERVNRGGPGPVWLFSRTTLEAIPDVYDEVDLVAVDWFLPSFLTRPRVAGIRLFAWLMVLLIVPFWLSADGTPRPAVRSVHRWWRRRHGRPRETPANLLQVPCGCCCWQS